MASEIWPAALLSKTVLVVEDDATIRTTIAAMLENAGYRVLEAATAFDAAAVLDQEDYWIDVVLSDVIMPGLNGIDMMERLHSLRPDISAVFMSGYSPPLEVQRALNKGWAHYLQKPFGSAQLLESISDALNSSSVGEEHSVTDTAHPI